MSYPDTDLVDDFDESFDDITIENGISTEVLRPDNRMLAVDPSAHVHTLRDGMVVRSQCGHALCAGELYCLRTMRPDADIDTMVEAASVYTPRPADPGQRAPINLAGMIQQGLDSGIITPQQRYV